jgi:uncharacterized SAM-binding protein YcdF (DUF218 family)
MEPEQKNIAERRWKHRCSVATLLVVLALLVGAAILVFRGIGRWLVVQDPLEPADAIAVLTGGMPYRVVEAAKIYKQGLAPEVWLTTPLGPGEELEELGVEYRGEEVYNAEILQKLGVPAGSIRVLNEPIVDTEDEVRVISNELTRTRKKCVILVTSPPHTRRVRTLWKELVGANPRVLVRAAPEDPYDAARWWGNTRDAFSVVRETLGLLNAWAGLPVRPHHP